MKKRLSVLTVAIVLGLSIIGCEQNEIDDLTVQEEILDEGLATGAGGGNKDPK